MCVIKIRERLSVLLFGTIRLLLVAGAASMISACANKEILVAKSATVPTGVDLSGSWVIRAESADTVRQLDNAEVEAAGGRVGIVSGGNRQRRRRSSGSNDSLVHVFLETAKRIKITQTEFGLFVSFDRSIVEEYRYGENRAVSVGPVHAARVSGWEERAYVIETLDEEQNKLIERYRLENGGALLIRHISILQNGEESLSLLQKFDRS